MPPLILLPLLPHRRHSSSPHATIASLRPACRLARGVEWGGAKSSVSCRPLVVGKQAGGRGGGGVVHVIRIVLVLISWRALRYGGASSSVPCGKQAGNGAMSSMSSMSSGFSSRGGRGGHCDMAGCHHPCRGVSKQASGAGAVSSSSVSPGRLVGASRLIPPGRPVRR